MAAPNQAQIDSCPDILFLIRPSPRTGRDRSDNYTTWAEATVKESGICGGSSWARVVLVQQRLPGEGSRVSGGGSGRLPAAFGTHLIEDILELVLRQSTALNVFDRAQLLRHPLAVLFPHRLHLLLLQLRHHLLVVPQVHLRADYQARDAGAVVVHLGEPFLADVFERGRRRDAEAHQEDVGLWV